MSDSNWQAIITDGSGLNQKWKQYLHEIAVFLQDLKNNGVEVLFRPFHEMNQGVFWWGGRPGVSGTRHLYQISHDYLTNVKRLDNLIWVWNIQDFGSLSNDAQSYNPGSNYFEVASLDVYEGFQTWKYAVMRNVSGGKPIAIGECDVLPDASRLVIEPLWTFAMSWSELTFQYNTGDKIRLVYTRQSLAMKWEPGKVASSTHLHPHLPLLYPHLLHPHLLQLGHLGTGRNAPQTPSAGMDAAVVSTLAECLNAPRSVAASTPPFAQQEPAHPLLQLGHLETGRNAPETPSA